MNEHVTRIMDALWTNNRSSSMPSAWLKDQVERTTRSRAVALRLEQVPEELKHSVRNRLLLAAEITNPVDEYPPTSTELEDQAQKLLDNIRFSIPRIMGTQTVKTDTYIDKLGSHTPHREWSQITDYAQDQYRNISAMADFSDTDSIDDLPFEAYHAFDELKALDYLCRALMVILGL